MKYKWWLYNQNSSGNTEDCGGDTLPLETVRGDRTVHEMITTDVSIPPGVVTGRSGSLGKVTFVND